MEQHRRRVVVSVVAIVGVAALAMLGLRLWAASAPVPDTIGLTEAGTLAACPATPNCVSSRGTGDAAVAPLPLPGGGIEELVRAVESLPRTTVVTRTGGYLHAESRTAVVGYVDDLELLVDEAAEVVHVRSASRLGSSDLGVNRDRVDALRELLEVDPT